MRRTLLTVFAIFILAIAGIGIWYWGKTAADEGRAEAYAQWVRQQKAMPVQFIVTAVPEGTPDDQPLYLSGSAATLGNWEAAGVPMSRSDDGTWQATVELMSGMTHGFKITRGTWGTVERAADGADLPNRTIEVDQPDARVEIAVASWVDEGKADPTRQTLTGDVRLHPKFRSRILGNERDLIVFLPPGYEAQADQRYPVLYMHDGQNLMNAATAYAGIEWGVDETVQRLVQAEQVPPVIVVGIYNTEQRTAEFTPSALAAGEGAGRADDYARLLIEEVKPFIDQRYRTATGTENTAMAGSGLGGLVTLHIARQHPDFTGRLAVLTPFLSLDGKDAVAGLGDMAFLKGKRLWLDMDSDGGKLYPGDAPMDDARKLTDALDAAGLKADADYRFTPLEGQAHGEAAWGGRFGEVLVFLWGN